MCVRESRHTGTISGQLHTLRYRYSPATLLLIGAMAATHTDAGILLAASAGCYDPIGCLCQTLGSYWLSSISWAELGGFYCLYCAGHLWTCTSDASWC